MKKFFIVIGSICTALSVQGQTYTLQDLEQHFLKNNANLIANEFNVRMADADIIQEKLWDNPNLSISEVNLWKTSSVEDLPPLIGKYGRHQQISVELEQVIETAGKRKKRVALKGLAKNGALYDYEELMRTLKKDLRNAYYDLRRINRQEIQLNTMLDLFTQMSGQYERQADLQNIRKADFYRVHTEMIGLKKEHIDLENEKWEALRELRVLTSLPTLDFNQITFAPENTLLNPSIWAMDRLELAKRQNLELRRQDNEINKAQSQLVLEKAARTPNLTVQVNYDRAGNIMRDFFGIGVSADLPIFNRNKGNIKAAQLSLDQHKIKRSALEEQIEQSIYQLEMQIVGLHKVLLEWPKKELNEQAKMIVNYQKHLQDKQVTLMEFIDFAQSFREANQAYLQLEETYFKTVEELQYIVGKDL